MPSDDIGNDVAEAVPGDLFGLNFSSAHHLRHQRVVMGELIKLAISIQIRAAVADVDNAQLGIEMERHGQRGAHTSQLRMLRLFLENTGVGLAERGLELREDLLRVGSVGVKEPLERVEGELLD